MKLKELEEKFAKKQADMGKVFEEALTTGGGKDGAKEYDFTQVKCLGDDVKGKDGKSDSIKVAEQVKAMDGELNELGEQIEQLRAAEQAASKHADRESQVHRPPFANPNDGKSRTQATVKSLGELVTADAAFENWQKHNRGGGCDINLPDLWPTDMLAKAWHYDTIRTKADMTTSAGWAPESFRQPGFVEAVSRPIQLIDIFPTGQTGQDAIKYMEETTRTHAAAEVAEGGAYAESTFVLTERSSPVQKIGDSLPVTDEQLEDVAQVNSYINGRLMFGVRQRLDGQVLLGDGTGANLTGLANTAGILSQDKAADPVPDAFFKAMTNIMVTGRAMPTHHIIHPTDWQDVRLLRTADGIYIWGNPSEAGPERMWGLPVVKCDASAAGTGWVGSFLPSWCALVERRGVVVQVGYVNAQFTQGKRTVRADMRAAVVFYRPAAFSEVVNL